MLQFIQDRCLWHGDGDPIVSILPFCHIFSHEKGPDIVFSRAPKTNSRDKPIRVLRTGIVNNKLKLPGTAFSCQFATPGFQQDASNPTSSLWQFTRKHNSVTEWSLHQFVLHHLSTSCERQKCVRKAVRRNLPDVVNCGTGCATHPVLSPWPERHVYRQGRFRRWPTWAA